MIVSKALLLMTNQTMRSPFILLIYLSSLFLGGSYEWHTSGGRPPLDRRAIAGLWKLTTCPTFPLKEFTVHPPSQKEKENEELLLMLKEDGSFQQFQKNEEDIDQAWTRWQKSRQEKQEALDQLQYQFLHGTWDYRDGKLILAADRAEPPKSDNLCQFSKDSALPTSQSSEKKKKPSDTLLTGRVVAKYSNKGTDRPLWREEENTNSGNQVAEDSSSNSNVDAYLSVPKGSVKVGRFFYPRNHPSFFDQPMYEPKKRGTVMLRQVLGALNTVSDDEEEETMIEKFRNTDFHNKTFMLTSHPIGFRAAKDKRTEEKDQRPDNVRVMQIQFHANNTFSTVAGIGENILRGKFSIMGKLRDQFWMQVSRFGFGRSVSGSVYSEGNSISHEDAKSYWGTIGFQERMSDSLNATSNVTTTEAKQLIEVKGSVLFGWGIEPIPEARFIMRELASDESEEEEDEDDDDDEDMNVLRFNPGKDLPTLGDEDGINLSNSDSFQ
ncbi:hypothetical protein FisN_15Lh243 [Fistulifera solaris]|uniref:Uncharacterized protein n=1 Tax=Fistulifera solaris TaxID=1519565 RepID=A0A1Z5JBE0_FISSO|nr:hypothetical protein FisN_15Lh243 [Fistulifera solaris]|eukprot:GAX11314.1 hypothetical protein FisN_15Lh243 [Fistulifera solaris]